MNSLPEITEIESKRRCDCIPKCTKFYRVQGIDVYCRKTLEQLAFDILHKLNGLNIMNGEYRRHGWTIKMENELIAHIEEHGAQNGTFSKLALLLGKNRTQVKSKVYTLEKQGRLKYKKMELRKRASNQSRKEDVNET